MSQKEEYLCTLQAVIAKQRFVTVTKESSAFSSLLVPTSPPAQARSDETNASCCCIFTRTAPKLTGTMLQPLGLVSHPRSVRLLRVVELRPPHASLELKVLLLVEPHSPKKGALCVDRLDILTSSSPSLSRSIEYDRR